MMSGGSTNTPASPSVLSEALGLRALNKSTDLYNTLPDGRSQPPVARETMTALASIFVKHIAHKVFGVHLVHGNFKVPEGTVLVGQYHDDASLRWVNTISTDDINHSSVHGHIYKFTEDGLCPYELQHGPLPDLSEVNEGFLDAFKDYITYHNLRDLLALQVLDNSKGPMWELVLDQGTAMVSSHLVRNMTSTRTIGWRFYSVDRLPPIWRAREVHVQKVDGNHKVFTSGAPKLKLRSVEELVSALTEGGVLIPRT